MKNVKSNGRLQLHKETLRSLTPAELADVAGASVRFCAPPPTVLTCNCLSPVIGTVVTRDANDIPCLPNNWLPNLGGR